MIENVNGATVITGEADIERFRLIALRGALALETLGMRRRGTSAANIVRNILGSKTRDKRTLFHEFNDWMVARGFRPYALSV